MRRTLLLLLLVLASTISLVYAAVSHPDNATDTHSDVEHQALQERVADRCMQVTHERNAKELYRESYDNAKGCQRANLTAFKEAQGKAWEFAPRVMFHPLEEFYMGSVEEYLRDSTLWDLQEYVYLENTTELGLLNVSRDADTLNISRPEKYFVTKGNPAKDETKLEERFKGAEFDQNDRSTSPMYYTIRPGRNHTTWVYTYWAFFEYNGCSNQEVLYVDHLGNQRIYSYIACEFGTHEADWEYVKVEVCQDLETVLRVSLSQHGWNDMMDCTKGQCYFHPQDATSSATHPLAFAALNSHALFRESARTWVYKQERDTSDLVANILAMNLVDRSLNGSKFWHPEPNNKNLIFLGDEWRWTGYQRDGLLHSKEDVDFHYHSRLNLSRDDPDNFTEWDTTLETGPSWVYFSGRFGWKHTIFTEFQTPNPLCLNDNQTRYVDCPDNGVFTVIEGLLGIKSLPFVGEGFSKVVNDFTASAGLTGSGSTSIDRKTDFRTEFLAFDVPPISKLNQKKYPTICADWEVFEVGYAPATLDLRSEMSSMEHFVIVFSSLAGSFVLVLLGISCWKHRRNKQKELGNTKSEIVRQSGPRQRTLSDPDAERYKKTSDFIWDVWEATPKLALTGFIFALFGANAVLGELSYFVRVMQKYLPTEQLDYDSFISAMQGMLTFLVFTNLCLTIMSLMFSEKYYLKLFGVHYDSVVQEGLEPDCSDRCANRCCNQDDCCRSTNRLKLMWVMQTFIGFMVLLLLLTGMVIFGVSSIIFIFDYVFIFACENVANFVTGICLDLTSIGSDVVLCGEDFAFFCNELSLLQTSVMLIGCVLLTIGEYFCALEAGITFGILSRRPVDIKEIHVAMLTRELTPLQRVLHSRVTGTFADLDVHDNDAPHKYQAATPSSVAAGGLSMGSRSSYAHGKIHLRIHDDKDDEKVSGMELTEIVPDVSEQPEPTATAADDEGDEKKTTQQEAEEQQTAPAEE